MAQKPQDTPHSLQDLRQAMAKFSVRRSAFTRVELKTLPNINVREATKIRPRNLIEIHDRKMLNIGVLQELSPMLDYVSLNSGISFSDQEYRELGKRLHDFQKAFGNLLIADDKLNDDFQALYKQQKSHSKNKLQDKSNKINETKGVNDTSGISEIKGINETKEKNEIRKLWERFSEIEKQADEVDVLKKILLDYALKLRENKDVVNLLAKGVEIKKHTEGSATIEGMSWLKPWIEATYAALVRDAVPGLYKQTDPSVTLEMAVMAANIIYHPNKYPQQLVESIEFSLENIGADANMFKRENGKEKQFTQFIKKQLDHEKRGYAKEAVFKEMTKDIEGFIKETKKFLAAKKGRADKIAKGKITAEQLKKGINADRLKEPKGFVPSLVAKYQKRIEQDEAEAEAGKKPRSPRTPKK